MNKKLCELIFKYNLDWAWYPRHIRFWIQGSDSGKPLIVTEDSWHLLYKHGKPRKLRKAK